MLKIISFVLLIGTLFFILLKDNLNTTYLNKWSFKCSIEITSSGKARLYYDEGGGFQNELSQHRSLREGKQTLRFILPDKELKELRFDPIEQSGVTFHIQSMSIEGPFGVLLQSVDLKKLSKRKAHLQKTGQATSKNVTFRTLSEDPQLWIPLKERLVPPVFWNRLSDIVFYAFCLAGAALICCFSKHIHTDRLALVAGTGYMAYLLAMYLTPAQSSGTDFIEDFSLLLLAVFLLRWTVFYASLKKMYSSPAFWGLVLYLLYIAFRALWLPDGIAPTRRTVYISLGILCVAFIVAPSMLEIIRKRGLYPVFFSLWILVASLVALWTQYTFYQENEYPEGRLSGYNFLFRTISGTACYVLPLLVVLLWKWEKNRRKEIVFFLLLILAIPLTLYMIHAKSRGVLLGYLFSALCILICCHSRPAKILTGLHLIFVSICLFSPFLYWMNTLMEQKKATLFSQNNTVLSVSLPAQVTIQKKKNEKSIWTDLNKRSYYLRPHIWKAYVKKSLEKPFFGHGFAGRQTLHLSNENGELDHVSPYIRDNPWNPHSLLLSVFYFLGIAGIILHFFPILLTMYGSIRLHRKTKENMDLLPGVLLVFSTVLLLTESSLMAYDKEAVLLRKPNDYWIIFWVPLIFSIAYMAISRQETNEHQAVDKNKKVRFPC